MGSLGPRSILVLLFLGTWLRLSPSVCVCAYRHYVHVCPVHRSYLSAHITVTTSPARVSGEDNMCLLLVFLHSLLNHACG
jgi:hypothetical protein